VFTNMGPKPIRATAAEQALKTPDDIDAAAEASLEGTDPPSDTQGSAEYRRHLAKVLVRRALGEAISR
jgi:carbon-monoxide dehydrogenase medium subunit